MTKDAKQVAEIGFSRFRLYTRTYDVYGFYYTINSMKKRKYDKSKMFVKNVESEDEYFGMSRKIPITAVPHFLIIVDGYGIAVGAKIENE